MRRLIPLLAALAVAALASLASAEEEVFLEQPTVLASPDTPPIVRRSLRGNVARIDPLTWPLPAAGPLLVLGLPNQDPAARAFAEAFGLFPPGGDLAGGYVVVTWQDGRRTVGAILADDAAAMAVARQTLRLDALDGQATRIALPRTWRWVRPRTRHRVLALRSPDALEEAAATAVAGQASAVLLPAGTFPPEAARARETLAEHGIPLWTADALAQTDGGLAILEPEAGTTLDAAFLRRTRARLGRGLLIVEDWNAAWCRPDAPTRIPTPPPPRPDAVLGALDGVVVRQGCGDLEILEALGGGLRGAVDDAPRAWEVHLLPLLPRTWTSSMDFLRRSARNLRREAQSTHGAVPWMAPLAVDLDATAVPGPTLAVPYVPSRVVTDGHLDERAWAHGTRWAWTTRTSSGGRRAPIEVLILSDGRRLHVALRTSAPHVVVECRIRDSLGGESRVVFASDPGGRGDRPSTTHATHMPAFAEAWSEEAYVGEAALSGRTLAGDAYPTRVFELEVIPTVDGRRTRSRRVTLVVVP